MASEKVKSNRRDEASSTLLFSLFGTIVLVVIKLSVGIFGKSDAVLTDAIESCGDAISTFLLILALRYSQKPADHKYPYGHGKIEPLTSFLVVIFLVGAAVLIAYHSIIGIVTNEQTVPETFTLYFLTGIIIYKEAMYQYVIRKARKLNSSAMLADAWHHRTDAITSLAALIGVTIAVLGGEKYAVADSWAALLGCLVILYNAYRMFIPILGEILDQNTYPELEREIEQNALKIEGVSEIEKMYIRKSGLHYFVDMHLQVKADITVLKGHEIAHRVKDVVMEDNLEIKDILIHIEPDRECMYSSQKEIEKGKDAAVSKL